MARIYGLVLIITLSLCASPTRARILDEIGEDALEKYREDPGFDINLLSKQDQMLFGW
jgi:hypothetical protein